MKLPAQKPNSEGQELKVSSKDEAIALTDILVGEVWLCSGQSNMQWAMNRSQHGKEEIAKADHPEIRLFAIKTRVAATPQDDVPHAWTACTPQTAAGFTAVGYHFGEALQRELKMPLGLIQSAWGGTEIEPWTPHEGFAKHASLKDFAKQVTELKPGSAAGNRTPSAIYNAMIHPLAPFSLRGAIWYQGESNCLKGDTARSATQTCRSPPQCATPGTRPPSAISRTKMAYQPPRSAPIDRRDCRFLAAPACLLCRPAGYGGAHGNLGHRHQEIRTQPARLRYRAPLTRHRAVHGRRDRADVH